MRWDDDAAAHRFDVDLPARLPPSSSIRAAARGSAAGLAARSDDPRMDNRTPPRWRFIYQGLGTVLDISQLTANVAVGVLAKPQHDLRRHVIVSAFHTETSQIGLGATGGYNFGRAGGPQQPGQHRAGGVTGARLDPSFGESLGEAPQPGWRATGRLGFNHDTRDYAFDPWTAVGLSAGGRVRAHRARRRDRGCHRGRPASRRCACSSWRPATCSPAPSRGARRSATSAWPVSSPAPAARWACAASRPTSCSRARASSAACSCATTTSPASTGT